jgi:hypothetical protein
MVGQPEIGQKTFLVSLDFPAGRGTLLAHCAIEKAGIHQPNGNERLFGRKLEEKASKKKYFSNLTHYSHTGLHVSEIFILWLVLGWKRS